MKRAPQQAPAPRDWVNDPKTYTVTIRDDSDAPAYIKGDVVHISPTAPLVPNCDVVFRWDMKWDKEGVHVFRLIRETPKMFYTMMSSGSVGPPLRKATLAFAHRVVAKGPLGRHDLSWPFPETHVFLGHDRRGRERWTDKRQEVRAWFASAERARDIPCLFARAWNCQARLAELSRRQRMAQ